MRGIPGKNIARILLVFMTLAMTVQAALSQESLEDDESQPKAVVAWEGIAKIELMQKNNGFNVDN